MQDHALGNFHVHFERLGIMQRQASSSGSTSRLTRQVPQCQGRYVPAYSLNCLRSPEDGCTDATGVAELTSPRSLCIE